ncbi:MAG: zinc-binding dehydrogenase [Planctomycetota bacterium]
MAAPDFHVIYQAAAQARLVEFKMKTDQPGPGEALVRTRKTLISTGTEIGILTGNHFKVKQGILNFPIDNWGYSNVCTVEAVGPGVSNVKPGDRIMLMAPHATRCIVKTDDPTLYKVPANVKDEDAIFASVLCITLHGVRTSGVCIGDSCAVIGQGLIGHLTLLWMELAGANPLLALDPMPERRALCRGRNCLALDPTDEATIRPYIGTEAPGTGMKIVMECSGHPKGTELALRLAQRCGQITIVSGNHQTIPMDLYTQFQMKELRMNSMHMPKVSNAVDPYVAWNRGILLRTIFDFMAQGRLLPSKLLTNTVPWKEAAEGYRLLIEEKVKTFAVAIDWTK